MIKEFQNNLKHLEIDSQKIYLVATSGGVDSMVICDLLRKSAINFSIAHANFGLRGQDSDGDEEFVRDYCRNFGIEFFSKKFKVVEFKQSGNYSTQMAARTMRYAWFKKLAKDHHFEKIITAHHLNDSLETFLINLSRGTGLSGLSGINPNHDTIVRPLYNFSKEEIVRYANANQINWREDSTNAENTYIRNKIRNQIFPILNEIHPHFLQNFSKTIEFNQQQNLIFNQLVEQKKIELATICDNQLKFEIKNLKALNPLPSYLYHLFSAYGFKHPYEIEKLLLSQNNREILSKTHRLVKNRNSIILSSKNEITSFDEILIKEDEILEKPLYLRFSKSKKKDLSATETLDLDKIKFPLKLRKKKTGDIFYPIGMNGKKKLSKFLKDEKLSMLEKEQVWLLVDDKDHILYIMGKRIDDRYKITEHTNNFLNIYSW